MRSVVWVAGVVAVLAPLACSSSSSGSKGSSGAFPYSGPSCQNGQPTGTSAYTEACVSCLESNCSSAADTTCINSTCSSYYTCSCACAVGDPNCQASCMTSQSSACMSCLASTGECYAGAVTGACSSQCGFDAGTGGGGDGGTATGSCATLMSCCSSLGTASSVCDMAASSNDQTVCQLTLSALQDGGICH